MEPTTKKCKNRKTKCRKQICSQKTVWGIHVVKSEEEKGLQWEGFAETKGFKPGMKE